MDFAVVYAVFVIRWGAGIVMRLMFHGLFSAAAETLPNHTGLLCSSFMGVECGLSLFPRLNFSGAFKLRCR